MAGSSEAQFNAAMDALASAINTKAGTSGTKTIAELTEAVVSIVVPSGTLNITENKTYDVTGYASAVVAVPTTDTSDATATAATILSGYTAYAQGVKITGTVALNVYTASQL